MLKKHLVTQSYVMKENDIAYKLEYYIFSELVQDTLIYGIEIKQFGSSTVESEMELVSQEEAHVLKLIDCFAQNFVFPYSLHEILEDMQYNDNSLYISYHM